MFGFHKIMSIYCILLLCLITRLTEAATVESQEIVTGTVNTVCFGDLGCLDFKPNPLAKLENIVEKFTLFTRKNSEKGQILVVHSSETITNSNFQPNNPTKFIIHGWQSEADAKWVQTMKNELLKHSDWNVLLVQWPSFCDILTAKKRATLVGQEVADLINTIEDLMGLDLNNVHLIGHSLGAHAAGFAGKHLKGLVGRITGLDPAGPLYEGKPPTQRLDHTDAQFVDVIHTGATNIFGCGIRMPCGHVDFYPNGGKRQPGCVHSKDALENPDELECDHLRVHELFTESINSKCLFVANKCNSYKDFQQGNCYSNNITDLNIMGLRAKKPSSPPGSKYFLITGDAPPYCSLQYKVTFNLAKPLGFALYDNLHINSTDSSLVISLPFNQGKTTKSYRDNVNKILYQ